MRHQPFQLCRTRPCRPHADGPHDLLRRGARPQPSHAAVDLQMIRTPAAKSASGMSLSE